MRLSLCMIVKDEERFLPGCLASVAGVADEVIIVDTGSADGTRELARAAGALVVERAWDDDFAAARNEALRHATGDWILQLDADERLAPGAGAGLRAAMARREIDLGMVRLHDAVRLDAPAAEVLSGEARIGEPLRLPRLYRRLPGIRYQGLVHETIDEWLAERGALAGEVEADIVHLGGVPALRVARGKARRNLQLLERRCALEPGSLTPVALLAAEQFEGGDLEAAGRAAERGWAMLESQPAWRSIHLLAVVRAQVARVAGRSAEVLTTVAVAERRQGPTSDLCYLRGCALELEALRLAGEPARALLQAAAVAYRAALAVRPGESVRSLVPGASGWAARVRLGTTLLRLGEPVAARPEFELAARQAPDPLEAQLGEAEAQLDAGDTNGAMRALVGLLGPWPDGWILAAAATLQAGDAATARILITGAGRRLGSGLLAPHRAVRARALAGVPAPEPRRPAPA
jgi:hypothetical protein